MDKCKKKHYASQYFRFDVPHSLLLIEVLSAGIEKGIMEFWNCGIVGMEKWSFGVMEL